MLSRIERDLPIVLVVVFVVVFGGAIAYAWSQSQVAPLPEACGGWTSWNPLTQRCDAGGFPTPYDHPYAYP